MKVSIPYQRGSFQTASHKKGGVMRTDEMVSIPYQRGSFQTDTFGNAKRPIYIRVSIPYQRGSFQT